MSGLMFLWWVLFSIFVLFVVLPTTVYVVTKCHFDAKNKSNLSHLLQYRNYIHGGNNAEKEEILNERKSEETSRKKHEQRGE